MFNFFQSTRFKKKNALFSNPIEMKYSGTFLKPLKALTARDLSKIRAQT